MLAVTLVCELNKANWKELLIEDGHTPYDKLKNVVEQVQVEELKLFLIELLKLANPSP
jgi:hypothetical protein